MFRKIARLQTKLGKLFPAIQTDAEFAWAASFGETMTGLPMIGEIPGHKNCWAALWLWRQRHHLQPHCRGNFTVRLDWRERPGRRSLCVWSLKRPTRGRSLAAVFPEKASAARHVYDSFCRVSDVQLFCPAERPREMYVSLHHRLRP